MHTTPPAAKRSDLTGVLCALVGLALAVVGVLVFDALSQRGRIPTDAYTPLSYLVTWVPMAGAVVVFCVLRPQAVRATLRLRLQLIDLLWGAAIGFACRMIAIATNLAVYGSAGLGGAPSIAGSVDPWLVFGGLVAPIVIAPVIEEVFFRGLALGSVYGQLGGRSRRGPASVIAVVVTAAVFTSVHLIGTPTAAAAATAAVPVFVLGAAAAAATLGTGRLGAALIGHAVFNAIAVVVTFPW